MPIRYTIDPDAGAVLSVAHGVLTDADLIEHKRRLACDPYFLPGMVELADARGIERLEATADGIRNLAAHDAAHAERLGQAYKLAIVASEDVVFGMARMYQMITEPGLSGVAVFRDLEKARAWLGMRPSTGRVITEKDPV